MAFVDIGFIEGGVRKDPFKGVALLGQHICFSEHGRAPRWKLRDALASFAFGKMRGAHGFAILLSLA
jgi:hypothetical protein